MSYKKLQSLYKDFEKIISTDHKSVGDFSDKALNIAIEINQRVDEIFKGRKNLDQKTEKYKFKVLKRLQSIKNGKTTGILDIDELLDEIIQKVDNILKINTIDLGFKIFPPLPKESNGYDGRKRNCSNEFIKANKYSELLKILLELGVDIDDIVIYQENLNSNKEIKNGAKRNYPYKIIYFNIKGIYKTLVISDEIGQATFIYDGLIKKELFAKNGKGTEINGLKPIVISYTNNFKQDLKEAIKSKINNQTIEKNYEIEFNNELVEKYGLKTLIEYRDMIESKEKELEEKLNIYKYDGKYFFGECMAKFSSVRINGKSLKYFPNLRFNIENKIGNIRGELENKEQLKELFVLLGLDIVEDEKIVWRHNLESMEEEIKSEANVYKYEGKYFFGNAKGLPSFPKIKGKLIKSYPNGKFNREHGIGDEKGIMLDVKNDVKKLYKVLGLDVIEDDREVWKKQLEDLEQELKDKANIYKIDGKFFFGEGNIGFQTLKIDGQLLKTFPSTIFIKENNLGNNIGMLNRVEHLKALFIFLGIEVILDDKEVWKKQLEDIEQDLSDKANIYKIDGKYFLGDANSGYLKIDIAGKKLGSFINAKINKENGIGNQTGVISKIEHFKELFKFLGIDYIEDEMLIWRQRIESIENELKNKANILYKVNGKYFFGDCKGEEFWPTINGKNLTNFPNAKFNKEHNIGNKRGFIYSKQDLRKLFIILFGEDKVI